MEARYRSSYLEQLRQENHIIWPQEMYFIPVQYTATGFMHNIHQHTITIKLFLIPNVSPILLER